jgi:FAD/FMN-containing dehydrogenase
MRRREFFRSTFAAAVAASLPRGSALAPLYQVARQGLPDVNAVRGDGRAVTLKGSALQELKGALRGRLLLAGNDGYDDARQVLNPSINRRPALIVRAAGAADVRSAVDFARENSLLVAVKCGGHSPSGQSTCDGGLMIDLSEFRGVRVDPTARRAWVTGGTLLGAVDHEAMSYGLVTPLGTVSHTGVGGLTTGGGFGRLARRFGLALDNVTAVDVVTADGVLRRASRSENADLYWGVRGGGGNFGVVTNFEFQLHPMQRRVVGGDLVFPIARARDVLNVYAEYSPSTSDDLYLDCFLAQPPGGAPGVAGFNVCYSGPEQAAERALAPLRKLGEPLADELRAIDYVALQRSGDVTDPRATGSYLKGGFTAELTPALIAAIVDGFRGDPRRMTTIFFQQGGGAIGRIGRGATAFAHRYAKQTMIAVVGWRITDDSAPHTAWIKQYWSRLEPFTYGFYVNAMAGDESATAINENYRDNYPRLVTIKNRYDPGNLFRLNANVQPTAKTPARH